MKNLDLNNYSVKEMNAGQMRETEGGLMPLTQFIDYVINKIVTL